MMTPAARSGLSVVLAGSAVFAILDWPAQGTASAVIPSQQFRAQQWRPPAIMEGIRTGAPAAVEAPTPRANTAQETYAMAVEIADCEQWAPSASPALSDLSDAYAADVSGAMVITLQREARQRDERCRRFGPADYRRVDVLLQEAAVQGSQDARSLQWQRRLDALLSRFQPADGMSGLQFPAGTQERAELGALAAGLETLALAGHRDSITALQQLLSSDRTPVADPVRAAAWRLVSYQTPGQAMPTDEKLPGRIEVLDELDDSTRERVLLLSRSLFDNCCRR